jgi:hypothetical protein
MSHLFTQWGAVAAPKIMGQVDGGKPVRLFGWDTPAVGGEYTVFLHAFLPELKEFLQGCGWLEHTWFHISDEPNDAEADTFSLAKASVADLLQDCKVVDALSSYPIYKKGIVERPIASADHMDAFLEEHVPHLWTYYCTVQAIKVPNRFIAMPSGRNGILGTLLYRYAIEGFLHWGFNFYNTKYSAARIDPFQVTDAGAFFPSGDPFLSTQRPTALRMTLSAAQFSARHWQICGCCSSWNLRSDATKRWPCWMRSMSVPSRLQTIRAARIFSSSFERKSRACFPFQMKIMPPHNSSLPVYGQPFQHLYI